MVLKNDNIGFRGQYERANKQFYLNASDYGITTFESIHKLLEKSTKFNMSERINIEECRELVIAQLSILNEGITNKTLSYRFEKLEKEMINYEEPNERIYKDESTIINILEEFTPISNIIIEESNERISSDLVNRWKVKGSIIFKNKLKTGQTFLFYPNFIKYSNDKEGFELHIKKVKREGIHSDFISYKESRSVKWGNINNNIFLDEVLIISFEKDI